MDVRIGVVYTAKEITLEMPPDADVGALREEIGRMLADEDGVLWLTDRHGRQVGVPVARVAYVEIGSPDSERRIGFASA